MRIALIMGMLAVSVMTAATPTGAKQTARAASKAPLARFPYLRWSADFVPKDAPAVAAVGHFRFWDGTALQDVEGRSYLATLVPRKDGKRDVAVLLQRMEADLGRMGATRLASDRVPASAIATINAADKVALRAGLGDIENDPVQTWTLRRGRRQVWFQFTGNSAQASIAVVEVRLD